MKSTVEFCICRAALFIAVVAGFHLCVALGFRESIWEPLAALCGAIGVIGLLGLMRIDRDLEQALDSAVTELHSPSGAESIAVTEGPNRAGGDALERALGA